MIHINKTKEDLTTRLNDISIKNPDPDEILFYNKLTCEEKLGLLKIRPQAGSNNLLSTKNLLYKLLSLDTASDTDKAPDMNTNQSTSSGGNRFMLEYMKKAKDAENNYINKFVQDKLGVSDELFQDIIKFIDKLKNLPINAITLNTENKQKLIDRSISIAAIDILHKTGINLNDTGRGSFYEKMAKSEVDIDRDGKPDPIIRVFQTEKVS